MSTLSDQEFIRYSRQLMLAQVGEHGQQRFKNSHVLIVGVGGLGCAAAQYLAAAGIGQLTIVDNDLVELSNLQRQILFSHDDVGRAKVESAGKALRRLNPHVVITACQGNVREKWNTLPLHNINVVLDCTDNLSSRIFINQRCWQAKLKLVSGAAAMMQGQVMSFDFRQPLSPCYQCWLPTTDEQAGSCQQRGVLSSVLGIIGNMQATAALRLLLGDNELTDYFIEYDAWDMSLKKLKVVKNPNCPTCTKTENKKAG